MDMFGIHSGFVMNSFRIYPGFIVKIYYGFIMDMFGIHPGLVLNSS